MSRRSPLLVLASLAHLVAAGAACTLDPAGALPPEGDGGAGPTTTGPGDTSSNGPSTSSTTSSSISSGDGGGSTISAGGGDGGAGGTGEGGTGGTGNGGSGGTGGGGPLGEWLTRVTGPDVQRVRDVAIDEAAGAIYVVGVAKGNAVTLDGPDPTGDADGEDAFVARLELDGTPVWLRVFGGASNDQARGVALGEDGRLFVTGVANGEDGGAGDLFADGLATPPASPWGWLIELRTDDGASVAGTGIAFGPVDGAEAIDVAVTTSTAIAIATCTGSCEGADGRDIVAASLDLATGDGVAGVFTHPDDQRSGAIAAVPGADRVVVTGQFLGAGLDLGDAVACGPLVGLGNADVFVATYDLARGPQCLWARSVSGTGNDVSDGLWVNAEGTAYVAARFSTAPLPISDDVGPHVVQVTSATVGWATPLEPGVAAGEALAVVGDGATLLVGGRLDATDDGYVVRLDAAAGAELGRRVFAPGSSRTRAVAADGSVLVAAGELAGTTDFLGEVGEVTEEGTDGFVLRFTSP